MFHTRSQGENRLGSSRVKRRAWMGAAGVGLVAACVVGTTTSASASDIAVVSVGGSSSVAGYTTYQEFGETLSLAVVGDWSGPILNSVQVCSGALGELGSVRVSPLTYRQDGSMTELGVKNVPSGGCETWPVGMNYSVQSDGELVRILVDVTYAEQHRQTVSFTQ